MWCMGCRRDKDRRRLNKVFDVASHTDACSQGLVQSLVPAGGGKLWPGGTWRWSGCTVEWVCGSRRPRSGSFFA